MPSTSWKKQFLFVFLCLFVFAGTASIIVFMTMVMPLHFARQAEPAEATLRSTKVGDSVFFGAYEQDNNPENGKEPIEWTVLAEKDDRRLLVSRCALDCVHFSDASNMATWDYSSILTWLNTTFYDEAFNGSEKTMVLTSEVSADHNPVFSTDPGRQTNSKVFLMSISEAYRYMRSDEDRQCEHTPYALEKGARTDGTYCTWWLRSPGYDASVAARVLTDGKINYCGYPIADSANAVRPCIWAKTE